MPPMPPEATDPDILFDWLEIKEQAARDEALKLFTELTLMPPEEVHTLHDITFDDWLGRYNVPRSLYAFLVSLCCDGMFMVPVDCLEAAEAIKSLQDMFLRNGGMFCLGGYGRVAEALCEAVRANGRVVLLNPSGLDGTFTVDVSRFETTRLTFDATGPLRGRAVEVTYYPAKTTKAVLEVTVAEVDDG